MESINYYNHFKTSVNNKKPLIYLKPQINTQIKHHRKKTSFDKIKSEIYKSIKEPETPSELNKSKTLIQYMTEYKSDRNVEEKNVQPFSKSYASRRKTPLNILREKVKNKWK